MFFIGEVALLLFFLPARLLLTKRLRILNRMHLQQQTERQPRQCGFHQPSCICCQAAADATAAHPESERPVESDGEAAHTMCFLFAFLMFFLAARLLLTKRLRIVHLMWCVARRPEVEKCYDSFSVFLFFDQSLTAKCFTVLVLTCVGCISWPVARIVLQQCLS